MALQQNRQNARVWYYKGFVEIARGQAERAHASLAEAVRMHASLRGPDRLAVSQCLERIRADQRQEIHLALAAAGPAIPDPSGMIAAK